MTFLLNLPFVPGIALKILDLGSEKRNIKVEGGGRALFAPESVAGLTRLLTYTKSMLRPAPAPASAPSIENCSGPFVYDEP
jgi:hypothetical protein